MAQAGDALSDAINREVAKLARAQADAVERAVEKALQGGEFGVMVDYNVGAWVDSRVPYGQLWDVTACGSEGVRSA